LIFVVVVFFGAFKNFLAKQSRNSS